MRTPDAETHVTRGVVTHQGSTRDLPREHRDAEPSSIPGETDGSGVGEHRPPVRATSGY